MKETCGQPAGRPACDPARNTDALIRRGANERFVCICHPEAAKGSYYLSHHLQSKHDLNKTNSVVSKKFAKIVGQRSKALRRDF